MKALWFPLSMLATGVMIGLLVAPDKGVDTRKKLNRQMSDMKLKWKKWKGETSDELEDIKDRFSHEIAGLEDDVRQKVLDLIQSSRPSKNKHREALA